MRMFAQLRKVDEAKRLVFGRLAAETVDRSGEIMDYAASKPYFQKWSQEVSDETGGQSLGNLRAMHGKVAAGKFVGIDFNDAEKAVDVCAKVVDDNEWQKVLEGVYTGFSIGGSYVGSPVVQKVDGKDVRRYVAKPNEGSLVDRPCVPSAKFFQIQKADGSAVEAQFKEPDPEAVTVNGSAEQVRELGYLMNEHGLSLGDVIGKLEKSFHAEPDGDEGKGASAAAGKAGEPDGDEGAAVEGKGGPDASATGEEKSGATEPAEGAVGQKGGAEGEGGEKPPVEKADAGGLQKVDVAGELQKLLGDPATLEKLLAPHVEPLRAELAEAKAQLQKIADQPAPTTIRLYAVGKDDDEGTQGTRRVEKADQAVVDSHGEKHEAAGLIKSLHREGGAPLLKQA